MRNYEELANAIIVQAVKDQQMARKKLEKDPNDKKAAKTMEEVERFFSSNWAKVLTAIDGRMIMKMGKEDTRV